MIYSFKTVGSSRIVGSPLLDAEFDIGQEVWVRGDTFTIEDVVLGKYFILCRKEKGLFYGELHEVLPDRTFKLWFSTVKEPDRDATTVRGQIVKSTYDRFVLEFVNESLKFVLTEELSVGEKRYITMQSKLNDE